MKDFRLKMGVSSEKLQKNVKIDLSCKILMPIFDSLVEQFGYYKSINSVDFIKFLNKIPVKIRNLIISKLKNCNYLINNKSVDINDIIKHKNKYYLIVHDFANYLIELVDLGTGESINTEPDDKIVEQSVRKMLEISDEEVLERYTIGTYKKIKN